MIGHKAGIAVQMVVAFVVLAAGATTTASAGSVNPNQFGLQGRANAASRMIVLGVQQGISSLPPTSGQSFAYRFDPELNSYVASELLGPTSFRSTQLIGKGNFSVRFAASYFELSDNFGPTSYFIEPEVPGTGPSGFARFKMKASAKVGLFNFAVNYGVVDRVELMFNLPITVVDAKGKQSFTSRVANLGLPADQAIVSGAATEEGLDALLDLGETDPSNPNAIAYRKENFDALGARFEDNTNAGVGRISIGTRVALVTTQYIGLTLQPELFFPSPSSDEYAGSDSWAVLPRLVFQVTPLEHLWLHSDIGYDYDFDTNNLRRIVWNAGASMPFSWFSIDAGVGGSDFDEGVEWTPRTIRGEAISGFPATIGTRVGGAGIGSTFVDFIGGLKVRVAGKTTIGGTVTVPVNPDGFRADAVGTVGIEQYF